MSPVTAPAMMPALSIVPSKERIAAVDCPELQWWFVAPGLDRGRAVATYEVGTGRLDFVRVLTASGPADPNLWDLVRST